MLLRISAMMVEASLISVRDIYWMTRTFAIVALRASHVVGYGLCIASASSLELTLRASTTQWLFEVIKAGGGAGGERPSPANTATWSM